jgi:hypothetical protein
MANATRDLAGYLCAILLAVFTYFYGLDSQFIPKNGDENPYAHITRLTAANGELLPLQSQLDQMRNTKPPLLFWQGIASTHGGKNWNLWDLRYPSVIYTLLTAAMLFLLGRKLSGNIATGFVGALAFLAFFSSYRFGRPFLTNAPEVFWLFLPFFILLFWRQAFQSRYLMPLLFGISTACAFWYKSFALGLPMLLGLSAWYAQQRHYRIGEFMRLDALKICLTLSTAVAIFSLWFLFDPNPQAVWQEFVIGENAGKFDPHGPSYLSKLFWGGSSIWSYAAAFLSNAGLLTFVVGALFFVSFKNRAHLSDAEKLLWLWIAALFISFCLPSQRSGRYLLAAMPALALLCALNWQRINRKIFLATLVLCGALLLGLAMLAARLQSEIGSQVFAWEFWLLLVGSGVLLFAGLIFSSFTRSAVNVSALLLLLSFAAFLRPLDQVWASYDGSTQSAVRGKTVAVPCNFRADDERYRFLLPGAEIVGYHVSMNLSVTQLAQRYANFAVQLPMQASLPDSVCAECKIIGQRLDIRGRQNGEELRDMFLHGKFYEHLFVREVLLESSLTPKVPVAQTPAESCR